MTFLRFAALIALSGLVVAEPLQSASERPIRVPYIPDSRILRKVNPAYPHVAIQRRIQGIVRFAALIGKDGRVERLRLISGHPLLISAAREAAEQWIYRPASVRGIPVRVATQIQIYFSLDSYIRPDKIALEIQRRWPLVDFELAAIQPPECANELPLVYRFNQTYPYSLVPGLGLMNASLPVGSGRECGAA